MASITIADNVPGVPPYTYRVWEHALGQGAPDLFQSRQGNKIFFNGGSPGVRYALSITDSLGCVWIRTVE